MRSFLTTLFRILLSLAVLAAGGLGLYYVFTHDYEDASQLGESALEELQVPEATRLAEYSWEQIANIAAQMESAGTEDEARSIAASYHLIDAQGNLTIDTKTIELADGSSFAVRLAGIYADTAPDGHSLALSFIANTAAGTHHMNANDSSDGGWEGSDLRAWLNAEFLDTFPADLRAVIQPAAKLTNNYGLASDSSAVTTTSDALWLPSVKEVCGPVQWNAEEYGSEWSFLDEVTNAEGSQYQLFIDAGVNGAADAGDTLAITYEGESVAWWYRTPFTYSAAGFEGSYFFNVMNSGYLHGFSTPASDLGVVVGFCI